MALRNFYRLLKKIGLWSRNTPVLCLSKRVLIDFLTQNPNFKHSYRPRLDT